MFLFLSGLCVLSANMCMYKYLNSPQVNSFSSLTFLPFPLLILVRSSNLDSAASNMSNWHLVHVASDRITVAINSEKQKATQQDTLRIPFLYLPVFLVLSRKSLSYEFFCHHISFTYKTLCPWGWNLNVHQNHLKGLWKQNCWNLPRVSDSVGFRWGLKMYIVTSF